MPRCCPGFLGHPGQLNRRKPLIYLSVLGVLSVLGKNHYKKNPVF